MASWAEQRVPDPLPAIPTCPYIVRKGEVPDFIRRSNILPWQPALEFKSNKWEPLRNSEGKFLVELPTAGSAGPGVTQALAPHISERKITGEQPEQPRILSQVDMREINILASFGDLNDDDFKPNGQPKLEVIRSKTGVADITAAELKAMWAKHQEDTV